MRKKEWLGGKKSVSAPLAFGAGSSFLPSFLHFAPNGMEKEKGGRRRQKAVNPPKHKCDGLRSSPPSPFVGPR
jgi:hypothetical protein